MPDETTPEVPKVTESIAPDAPDANHPEDASDVDAQATEAATAKAKPPRAVKAKTPDADTPESSSDNADAEAQSARAPKAAKGEDGEKPARPPKKEKAPALEDKPFTEFINQHYLPALTETLAKVGITDLELKFEKRKLPIPQMDDAECWQVLGSWQGGNRQFIIVFSKEDIQAPKFFACADYGTQPSLLESFMIDERKINLDLLLLYTVQRLNGQKWLVRN
ncbi:DUF2996 domain-containing protein [Phormidium tenue FACHB-886]|nr:DUF2996 domain-containing protein [Phormidium tenue FACHB-886]